VILGQGGQGAGNHDLGPVVATHGINSYDGSCPVRHADLLAVRKTWLRFDDEDFALAIISALTADAMRQTRSAAMRALVRIRFGQMPVGPALALAGLGRFFLGDSHFKFLQKFLQ
jgi:hypothetical protein